MLGALIGALGFVISGCATSTALTRAEKPPPLAPGTPVLISARDLSQDERPPAAARPWARAPGHKVPDSDQRVEDVESRLALLEDHRRHGTLGQGTIQAADRLIAKLAAASATRRRDTPR